LCALCVYAYLPRGDRMKPTPEERHPEVATARDLQVITIPDGKDGFLPAGTKVRVTQTLGTSYTVQVERGGKVRVHGEDGDAIGQAKLGSGKVVPTAQTVPAIAPAANQALRKVFDPEIPVDIVNLGLVHELVIEPKPGGTFNAKVRMGLTSPGCGMGDVLVRDVQAALGAIEGVSSVDAQVVLFPVWNPYTMMSEAAKLKLGML
ncbi:MAG TPA: iron-sulfur cluster assembly protein, partial [Candidatus Thermoplasmatota archaeon]|nr:iron-sulfur cluster assembly protein [Candidatus Thermoplasmatota archaeon]